MEGAIKKSRVRIHKPLDVLFPMLRAETFVSAYSDPGVPERRRIHKNSAIWKDLQSKETGRTAEMVREAEGWRRTLKSMRYVREPQDPGYFGGQKPTDGEKFWVFDFHFHSSIIPFWALDYVDYHLGKWAFS